MLHHFYTTYAPHQNFAILLVPHDRSAEALRASVHRAALPWPSVPFQEGQARQQLDTWSGLDTIPYLVWLDRRGRVLASSVRDGATVGPLPVLAALQQRWQARPCAGPRWAHPLHTTSAVEGTRLAAIAIGHVRNSRIMTRFLPEHKPTASRRQKSGARCCVFVQRVHRVTRYATL